MAFVPQDATGLIANANTYATVAEFETYWLSRNKDISGQSTEAKEAALILGWEYTDSRFEYQGSRLNGRTQTTEFPRQYLYDCEGNAIDGIPYEIKNAQMEYAKRELDGVTLQDDTTQEGNLTKIKKKIGPLEKEFEYSPALSGGEVKNYPTADNKIPSFFICNSNGDLMHA